MGVGRRMKKQGPPEPLPEEHFEKLKRKVNAFIDDALIYSAPPAQPRPKKQKTAKKPASKSNGTTTAAASKKNEKNPRSKKSAPEPASDEDEDRKDAPHSFFDDIDDPVARDDLSGVMDVGFGDDDFIHEEDSVYDSDAEAQNDRKAMFSEDEDESDAEEKLTAANIAGLSRKLDDQLAQEAANAQLELEEAAMQTNIERPVVLDDEEEDDLALKTKALLAPDLQLLRTRITDTIRVLDDFANLAAEGRNRSEYTSQLLKDICAYYGYSEYLAEKLMNLFTPREAFAFFEANETARPVVIRTNTLRTHRRDLAQALINRGVTLEPVGKWSKVGLQIFESNVPLGATPEYLAGHYILQAASSFLPVMALAPQEGERALDMAAAPGGKTTHMAAMMKNTGCIFANDPSKARAKGLIGNIHRLGARNVIVCNYDAREFPRVMGGFDRVLLDAPCSGTGVIAKDPSVKTNKDEKDFMILPHTQKQLLLAAIDSVNHASKTGGYLVYSTCSVTVEENEQVVNYALSKRPNVKLVTTDLPFGKEGFTSYMGKKFDPSLRLTRRYYPHTYNVDGFFVAKFQKIGPTPANLIKDKSGQASSAPQADVSEVIDKTPIAADDDAAQKQDEFGGFDDDEDEKYIERAKHNAMRKRGLDPKSLKKPKTTEHVAETSNGEEESKGEEKSKVEEKGKAEEKNKGEVKSKGKAKSKKKSTST
ncbi:cytosine-5--methyltransferase NCL1 [Annulohypoxylon maeteangense]|uniref:cytosine-5--methyltransferase NCL1 n=1 Tax=Annulohypoxylon maeteangense TaxID=1927788 RepID=UPI0020075DB7|nr:cytosine-5--methyltransferase NCL1 [Annulohypoxylon maeteangense]KAI0884770.1 cytosine-5--methyltransferase NCL1 [Annulohypoxylon maeteangense]